MTPTELSTAPPDRITNGAFLAAAIAPAAIALLTWDWQWLLVYFVYLLILGF